MTYLSLKFLWIVIMLCSCTQNPVPPACVSSFVALLHPAQHKNSNMKHVETD